MAFLDNSGDIILDAVLTDTGRFRLARGDGSFKIAKFALGDDEVNYALYQKNHSSGSAYFDLEILQTPVLEAFTDNAASMKSKLLSIPRNNLLYLPILKANTLPELNQQHTLPDGVRKTYVITVDETTEKITDDGGIMSSTASNNKGILTGFKLNKGKNFVRVDQGLDTTEISADFKLDSDLTETQYILEMDNRFGSLTDSAGSPTAVSFIDDDNIATYYLSQGGLGANNYVLSNNTGKDAQEETIAGPRGTTLQFKVKASIELASSTYLFTQLGGLSTASDNNRINSQDVYYIDTTIRITGATTGYRIDIPVRYVKKS